MGEQLLQQRVRETVLIGEVHRAEHAAQPQVGIFDGSQRIVKPLPDLRGLLPHSFPAVFGGNVEPMLVRVGSFFAVTRLGQQRFVLLIPHVAQPLIEQQAEDVLLVVAGIDRAAQDVRRAPQMSFKFLLGDCSHRYVKILSRVDVFILHLFSG